MDDRLKKALDFSNYMITLDNQKRILKEKYQEDLLYYYGGGTFVATKELITFCYSMREVLLLPSALLTACENEHEARC